MIMVRVESSNIHSIGYDPETKKLAIKFKSGGGRVYSGVTDAQHTKLMAAKSHGKHYHQHIKGKFDAEDLE